MTGVIRRVNQDKGYGFLAGADGVERFFHHTEVRDHRFAALERDQTVEFEPDEGPKGPRARDVRVAA